MLSATRLGWLLLGVVFGVARPGLAAEIDWQGAAQCPDTDEVRFRIERALGMPLSHAAPLRLRVRAEPAARGYMAHIDVEPGAGAAPRQRALVASECGQLADMVAVAIALALDAAVTGVDPGSALDGAASGSDTDVGSGVTKTSAMEAKPASAIGLTDIETSARPTASDDPAPVKAAAEDSGASSGADAATAGAGWRPGASLWFVGDTGSLPSPGAGLSIGVSIERARFQLRASGTGFFAQHRSIGVPTGASAEQAPGADLALVTGALSACALPFGASGARFAVFGCGGWELGRLSGEGTGIQRPRQGASLWNAPRLDAGASLALGSTALRVGALLTLALPLERENFMLADLGGVHRPPGVVGRAAIGVEWIPK